MDTQSSDLCSCALDSHRNIACCINCCFSVWGEKCLMVIGNASVGAKKREFYSYSMFRKSLTLLTQGLGMYKVKRQRSNTQNNPGQIISSVKHEDNPGSFCSMSYFSQCSCRRSQSDNKKVAIMDNIKIWCSTPNVRFLEAKCRDSFKGLSRLILLVTVHYPWLQIWNAEVLSTSSNCKVIAFLTFQ